MIQSNYKALDEQVRMLESENKQLKLDLENKNELLNKPQQKRADLNFNNLIFEHIDVAIYLVETKTGNILYTNPIFEELFGYNSGELIGKNVSIINAETGKSPKEIALEIIDKLEQFGSWNGEVVSVKKDGTVFYGAVTVSTFDHPQYGTVWVSTQKDISEQKETSEALLQSRANVLAVLENTTDGIWAINTCYEILYVNDVCVSSFLNNFGVHIKPGVNILLALPEPLRPLWKSRYDRVLSNDTFSFIDKIDTERGLIYFEVFMNPIVIKGKVIGASFFGKDITERIKAVEALKDSFDFLTSSLESQKNTVLFSINNKYQYLYFNEAHFNGMKYAYDKDIKVGMNILDCITSEDDRIAAKDNYDRALKGESHTNIRAYGKEKLTYFESFFNPILNDKNEVIGATGLARDITSRKEKEEAIKDSEEKLALLLNSTAESIYGIDLNGNCTFANEACIKILGYKNEKELLGQNMHNLMHHTYPDGTHMNKKDCLIYKAFKQGVGTHVDNEVLWKANNTSFPAEYSSFPQFKANKIIGAVVTFTDITVRKTQENKLLKYTEELTELNDTKDRFFSIIAHDLKAPFDSVLGFCDILLEMVKNKDYDKTEVYAEIIRQSAQKTVNLLLNLMEWSRSQTNTIKFNPKIIELGKLITDSVELMNYSALQKTISISMEFPDNVSVFADKDMIDTILRNLISNAIKYTNQGGKITVLVEKKSKDWLITIADNGTGIDEDLLGDLFRVDVNTSIKGTQNETGTGLGLILCKEFIKKHDGIIWVESEVGKGSKFNFTLPLIKSE